MPNVIADITMSLDGFVTGRAPMNNTGSAMHLSSTRGSCSRTRSTPRSSNRRRRESGAVVMGRRLFDIVDGPGGWNERHGVRRRSDGDAAVLRRHPLAAADVRLERELGMRFTFVGDLAHRDRPGAVRRDPW